MYVCMYVCMCVCMCVCIYAEKLFECNIAFLKVGRVLWNELMYSESMHAFLSFCDMLSVFVAINL